MTFPKSRLSSLVDIENKSARIDRLTSDEDKYDLITDINDNIFDKIVSYLNECNCLKRSTDNPNIKRKEYSETFIN